MSDKPVTERLQVKHGRTLAVMDAPENVEAVFAAAASAAIDHADVVLLFAAARAAFDAGIASYLPALKPTAILWVAYPKLTSKLAIDLNRDIIHAAALGHGLTPVSQIAINHDWSALRLKLV